ncbi:hypothetical protein RhiirB3_467084 [Rhizophagus irregularis]|nr:hypothetical protein RhiirB3_467084 [Rhizophagus irregularis]
MSSFMNCSGLQNKKYRRSSRVHRALLRKKNREEDEGENQREKNRKARLKKDLMLAGGTRVYKNLTVLQEEANINKKKYELNIKPRILKNKSAIKCFFIKIDHL